MSIDLSTPLTCTYSGANNRYFSRDRKNRPFNYDDRLAAIAEAWDVPVKSLLNPTLADALAEVADLDAQREELKPIELDETELKGKAPQARKKAVREAAVENQVRAEQRKVLAKLAESAQRMVQAGQNDQLTYDHIISVLPVAEEVKRLKELSTFLAGYTRGGFNLGVRAGENDPNKAVVDEVRPQYVESLSRILSLDYLIESEMKGYALFADPMIPGALSFRYNVDIHGNPIEKINDYTDEDRADHVRAKDWQEAFQGGAMNNVVHEVSQTNQFNALAPFDRAVAALARGLVTGLELSIPATWTEYQDRLYRYSRAGFEEENRDKRFSKDVFGPERRTTSRNRGTGEEKTIVTRTNLRTGETEYWEEGVSLPEPSFSPSLSELR